MEPPQGANWATLSWVVPLIRQHIMLHMTNMETPPMGYAPQIMALLLRVWNMVDHCLSSGIGILYVRVSVQYVLLECLNKALCIN